MAKLIYCALCSLDGYTADRSGAFDWAAPGEEVHSFVNDLTRPIGTHLYGRRMYDTMVAWETMDVSAEPALMADFQQIWRSAEKIVYSRQLEVTSSARTRIERDFEPDAVRELKASATADLAIGGPEIAALAFHAGLIDQIQLFLSPIAVGGGTPALPTGLRLDLTLTDERRFTDGTVYLRYAARR